MHDRNLAPSYPGFSIDSYKGGKKPSFINEQMTKSNTKAEKAMKSKEIVNCDYEFKSQNSSDEHFPVH